MRKPATGTRCAARSKRTHEQCGQFVTDGATVCHWHGGDAPAAKAKAKERVITEQARKLIPDLTDLTPIADPLGRLLELATEADGFRESLRRLANDLDNRIRFTDAKDAEQLRSEVAVYRGALGDVTSMLVAIAKLDIDSRLARIQERQLDLVMAALSAGMRDAGLSDDTKRKVMAGAGRHLRSVAG